MRPQSYIGQSMYINRLTVWMSINDNRLCMYSQLEPPETQLNNSPRKMSCTDYSGLYFVVTPYTKSYGYRHRRNLANSAGEGGARSQWVLGTLIYEGVTKRWKTDLNQSQYAHNIFPPLSTNLCAPLQLSSKTKNYSYAEKYLERHLFRPHCPH